jgi:hypothetical protein
MTAPPKGSIETRSPALRGESRIRRDADQGLAEVPAAQHLGEGGGDHLKSLANILAVTDLAGSDPGCHLGQERIVPVRGILADGEVPHPYAAGFGAAAFLRSSPSYSLHGRDSLAGMVQTPGIT